MDTPKNGLKKQEGIVDSILSLIGIRSSRPIKKVETVAQPPQKPAMEAPKQEMTAPKPYVTPTHPGTGRWLRNRLR
jgi:hypothetical protein